ncbi:MAG: hypothetical protein PGN09_06245 [Sphingomonas fennica]
MALIALAIGATCAQSGPPRREQDAAFAARQAGQVRPLRDIEGRVIPRMGGASYLGPEYDAGSGSYRLKFMRGDSVIWVDVDGRTGAITGRSGE